MSDYATMFNCPAGRAEALLPGCVAILGVPVDIGTTGYPGTRFGPSAIRAASSEHYEYLTDDTGQSVGFENERGPFLQGVPIVDLGDIDFTPGQSPASLCADISQTMQSIFAAGALPVVLGGDHSITFATMPQGPAHLIHIDAHSDFAPWDSRHSHHHGNVLTRLVHEKAIGGLHQFGTRLLEPAAETPADLRRYPMDPMPPADWLKEHANVPAFLSIDIDVIDPAFAPGTGTPVPRGTSPKELCEAVRAIARSVRLVGLDLVEVNPMRDASGMTERIAVEIILAALAGATASR